jgi:hypothetical protein
MVLRLLPGSHPGEHEDGTAATEPDLIFRRGANGLGVAFVGALCRGIDRPLKAGPPTEHLASGPYADHHLLCVNGAMTGSEGLRRGATEFPPMRHSSAPYFSVSARNQTDATNRQFLSFQQKPAGVNRRALERGT